MKKDDSNETKLSLSAETLCRLKEFQEYTNMSLNAFVDSIGSNYTTVYNQFEGKRALSLDTVLGTLASFSELSADYIMRGRGDMLISKFNDSPDSLKLKYSERIESLLDTIQLLNDTIKTKNALISSLKEENEALKTKLAV